MTFSIFFLGLGAIIGSFLNVILYRYNTGKGIMGRSMCFSCKRSLSPIDLVPVLSYVAFKGRCRTCKSKISWQYPAVELLTAILFWMTYMIYAPIAFTLPTQFIIQTLYTCTVMAFLVLIIVYDIRHKIIPDFFSFSFAALSFITLFLGFDTFGSIHVVLPTFVSLASGLILAFPFYLLWLISDGRWMGLGDAKLALGIGWFLGLSKGASAIVYGFWIGAAVSLFLLGLGALSVKIKRVERLKYFTRRIKDWFKYFFGIQLPTLSMKSEIPFAPFLIAGLLITFFFGYNIFEPLEYLL